MKKIRRFYLQNERGERYDLNGESGAYASDISGLGYSLSPSFADLTHGFFLPTSNENDPRSTVAFTVTFTKTPYQAYTAFVDWIHSAGTITLVYDPTGSREYYRTVTVNFLQKGEKDQVGWLEVPCSFFSSTPWYLPKPAKLELESFSAGENKRYTYRYSDDVRYGNDSSATLSGIIQGAGHVPGALELTYYGAITNPKIRLVGNVSGKTYGLCSITTALEASDTLKVSTRYERSFAVKVTASGVEADLLNALDLSTTPFFRIPIDEPCTVSIEADTPFTGAASLVVFYYYRSV